MKNPGITLVPGFFMQIGRKCDEKYVFGVLSIFKMMYNQNLQGFIDTDL